MIYAVLAAAVLITAIHNYALYRLWALASKERKHLEDRLIALTDKDASILVGAQEQPVPGDVTYIDEAREYELSHSTN